MRVAAVAAQLEAEQEKLALEQEKQSAGLRSKSTGLGGGSRKNLRQASLEGGSGLLSSAALLQGSVDETAATLGRMLKASHIFSRVAYCSVTSQGSVAGCRR